MVTDILSFTKNNVLYKHYFSLFLETKIASDDTITQLQKIVDQENDNETVEVKTDINKMFSLFFNVENRYVTKKDLCRFAKISADQAFKPLLILNSVSFLDDELLKILVKTFEIILIVSDMRDSIAAFGSFESLIIDQEDSFIEILNENNFKEYIENKINEFISEEEWNSFLLKENSEKNQKILTKICFFN